MARRTTTIDPTATATDPILEDLPDFEQPSPAGVRHSEQCGDQAPWGARCEHRKFHDDAHSWQAPRASLEVPTHEQRLAELDRRDDALNGYHADELPGMPERPEPETTDYTVPTEASFGKADLVEAPGLKAIAERLIAEDESLEHLVGIDIGFFWRRRGGTQGGNKRYSHIKRPGLYENFYSGGSVVYLIDLSADHIREAQFTEQQIEACIYRELCKTAVDPDDNDAYRINGPDFSGFVRELDKFGAWSADLREVAAHARLLPLDQALAETDADAGDDGEESD